MPNGVGQVAVISTQPTATGNFSLNGAMTLGTFQYNNPNSNNGGQSRSLNGSGGVITFQTSSGNALFWMQSGELFLNNLGISFVLNSTTEWRMDSSGEVGGVISGTGGILKTGAGQLWLNGTNNSYSGLNTITGGLLTGNSLANSGVNSSFGRGNFSISNGGTLQYFGATASTDRTFTLGTGGGVIDILNASGSGLTLSGIVSGSGSLTLKATSGKTLVLSGNNSYTGGTFIQGGTIQLGASERLANSGALTIASNSTFDLSTFNETVGAVQMNGSGGGISGTGTLTASSYTIDGGGITANLAGSAALTKNSANTLILVGANTYTGGTFINGGTIQLTSSERLADGGSITISNGSTLQLGGTETVGSVSMTSGNISNGSLVGTAYNFDSGTVSSNLGGSAALTKNGTGLLTLSGTNTFTGGTVINQGTLQLNSAASLSGSTVNNGIVRFQQGSTATFGGTISGTGALEKTGSGILTLGGSNTYAGTTTISGGTLRQGVAGAIPGGTSVTLTNGNIDLNGFALTVSGLNGTGNVLLGNAALTVNNSSNNTLNGIISGSGSLVKGSAGSLTLNGANTYSGGTTVNGGILVGAAANSIQGNVVNNATVRFSADHTYAGNMSGTGAVDITSGNITFSGNNSYSGGTTVSNASLTANSASLSGPVTLNGVSLAFNQQSNGSFNGSISGSGSVTKSGAGELALANASTFSGTFAHQQGGLAIGDNQSFGTSQVSLASGTTVRADGGARVVTNSLTMGNNVTFSGNQDLTFTNVSPINLGIGQNLTSTNTGTTTLIGKFDGAAGSVLSVSNGTLAIGNSQSFVGFRSAGLLDIGPGATLKILSAGFADVSPQTELNQGRIIADNGIALGASKNLIGNGVVDAKIAAAQGSIISATTGNLTIGKSTSLTGFVSDGELYTNQYTVTINDANQAVLGSLTQLGNNSGAGTLTAGTAVVGQTSMHFLLEEGKNLVGHGAVNGNFKNQGDVIGDGTALNDRIVFESDWIVKGNGSFTNTLIKGTYSPGNSPAIVTGLNQAFAGKIEFELGGLLPGFNSDNYDQLNDSGTISLLDGTILKISQFSNFMPHIGDSFQIMNWQGGLTGAFSGMEIDPFFSSQGIDFKINYFNKGGAGSLSLLTISAVPEPSSIALLMVAMVTVGWRRARVLRRL